MIAKVDLIYADASKNRQIEVTVRDGLRGVKLMDAVDKAVEKNAKDDWTRWNLVDVQ